MDQVRLVKMMTTSELVILYHQGSARGYDRRCTCSELVGGSSRIQMSTLNKYLYHDDFIKSPPDEIIEVMATRCVQLGDAF